MPKVILEYNLPEESEEYELAMNGSKYHSILWELQNYARTLRKYDERKVLPKEEIVNKIYELLKDYEA